MKRPRSYGDDLDLDSDRLPSHRRPYSKPESSRKGSSPSSYDRSLDDDREPARSSRKRFDHDVDGYDRRKSSFDRYAAPSPSARGLYAGERLHRSESFSVSRREYPKGFRSERDRSRRDGGSSWRRSGGWKEAVAEEIRSPASDSLGKGGSFHGAGGGGGGGCRGRNSEERGVSRSKDSPSGEQSRSVGTSKAEESWKESCSSSEMEEGELEPDPDPEQPDPEPPNVQDPSSSIRDIIPVFESERCKDKEEDSNSVSEASWESRKSLGFTGRGGCDGEEAKSPEVPADEVAGDDNVVASQNDSMKGKDEDLVDGEEQGTGKRDKAEATECSGKHEIGESSQLHSDPQEEAVKNPNEGQMVHEEVRGNSFPVSHLAEEKLEEKHGESHVVEVEVDGKKVETRGINLEIGNKEGNGIDLEMAPEGNTGSSESGEEACTESNREDITLRLLTDNPKEQLKDKGKSPAVYLPSEANSMEEEDAMESPSIRGFELVFRSDSNRPDKINYSGVVIGKKKDEKPKFESLDLSLALPNVLLDNGSRHPQPTSPSRGRSIQSLPTSFRTMSDGFTTSISYSGSQTFTHNPSCSLNQNSLENYEHSVGSRPLFQPVDSNGTVWHGQSSNDPKRKGGAGVLFHRLLMHGNGANNSVHSGNVMQNLNPSSLARQSSLPRQLSPTHSLGSRETRSEHNKDRRLLTRERSSSSLFRSEQRDGAQLVVNGVGVVDRIVNKIVAEPIQLTGRLLQEMSEQSVTYLTETICEMVTSADKHGQLKALQEALQKRSDLTLEILLKCNRMLLAILVSLKTGLPDFIRRGNDVSTTDLAEIFLNTKCRNLSCRSILPVDECDCKICLQKNGFCSACMCLVCSKFDLASNTCSWVGCDVCLHWCHTNCGLRESYIRNGRAVSATQETTEMQFHCVACDHPSEMFGFVKEVFKTCAKEWKAETLARELQYVRQIFSASNDTRGQKLCDVAGQLLVKLENKANHSEVITFIMAIFAESESNIISAPSSFPPKEPPRKNAEGSNDIPCSSKAATWFPSVSSDKAPRLESKSVLPSMDCNMVGRQIKDVELKLDVEKQPVADELDSVVRFKQAEAKLYQERSDDARREAEGLKRIAIAKNVKIEEDYASRISKLRLGEAEERRRQKLEELQVLERAHCEYFNMKMRMEADIKDLLLKMDTMKRNLS